MPPVLKLLSPIRLSMVGERRGLGRQLQTLAPVGNMKGGREKEEVMPLAANNAVPHTVGTSLL